MPQMKYEKHNARQYEQILRAARQLFVEKGIERVSFSAVADSCGIARATLYKYFPDKESLLWAIHRQALRTLETHCCAGGGASAHGPGTPFPCI